MGEGDLGGGAKGVLDFEGGMLSVVVGGGVMVPEMETPPSTDPLLDVESGLTVLIDGEGGVTVAVSIFVGATIEFRFKAR